MVKVSIGMMLLISLKQIASGRTQQLGAVTWRIIVIRHTQVAWIRKSNESSDIRRAGVFQLLRLLNSGQAG